MTDFYLELKKDGLKKTEKEATNNAIETYGDDGEESKNALNYPDCRLDISEFYFDEKSERLVLNGMIYQGKEELAYISSFDLPVGLDMVVDLVQTYMKKLGKLKTVLEATK